MDKKQQRLEFSGRHSAFMKAVMELGPHPYNALHAKDLDARLSKIETRLGELRRAADVFHGKAEPNDESRIKVHKLAEELGLKSAEVLALAGGLNIEAKSAQSSLTAEEADKIRDRAANAGSPGGPEEG